MYTFLNRLLREILALFMVRQADKIGERERLNDEEIVKKYGEGTLVLKNVNTDSILASYSFLYVFLIFCVVISILGMAALRIFVADQFEWKITAILFIYIPLFIGCKIGKTIYITGKDIITKENIIIRRAFKEDRIVTYDEINQATQSKKIKIKKAIVYIPTSKDFIKIPLVGLKGDLAIIKIRQRSKIFIPEFTDIRKKYMGQASISGIFNFFGFLFFLALFPAAGLRSGNSLDGYINNLLTEDFCIAILIITIVCFFIGKLFFLIGQYKLRKDINAPEHVKIKL